MPACVVDPREPTCRPWALSVARCCLETGLWQPRRLRAPLSQPCRSEGAADGANGASAPDTSRGPTPPGRLGAQPPRRQASSVGHQPGSLPPPRCQRVCWAPGPGRPSERSCSGRGPGSLPPSRNSSCRLRGGGRGFAGLSPRFAVAGSAGLQPGSSRCLSPGSQSFGHGGSFSLTRRGGWERPEIETPSPGGVSRSPVPAAAASPWRRTCRWWPCPGWALASQCLAPPWAQQTVGGGSTEAGTGSRRRRGPSGDGSTAVPRSQGSDAFARKVQGPPPPRGQSAPAWGTAQCWGALDVLLSASGPGSRGCGGLRVSLSGTGLHPVGGAHVWAPEKPWCLGPRRPVPVRSPLLLPSTP